MIEIFDILGDLFRGALKLVICAAALLLPYAIDAWLNTIWPTPFWHG